MKARDEFDSTTTRLNRYRMAWLLVQEQAEDERLWFIPETIGEANLQQALRRLSAIIEGEAYYEAKKTN